MLLNKKYHAGFALLPIVAMTFLFTTVGGAMLYVTNQRQKALYAAATAAQGKLAANASLNITASVLDAQVVRGFTVITPPNATYWTVYPASAAISANAFTFIPGIVAAPHDAAVISTASMLVGDLCNPASLSPGNRGAMFQTGTQPATCGTAGANPATCCYHVPSTISLRSAIPAQYLEVVANIGNPLPDLTLSTQIGNLGNGGKNTQNVARVRIPALAPLPPPTCAISPQYDNIFWHQYDLLSNYLARPPADFAQNTEGFQTRIRFPVSAGAPPNANFPPGTINGVNTAATNPILLNAAAANTGPGVNFTIRPPDIGNVAATFTLPGEVEGPGGIGYCPRSFNQLVLPAPTTCNFTTGKSSIFWLDQTSVTYTQPIPVQPSGTAPLPPAYLVPSNTARVDSAGGTVNSSYTVFFPLSISSNSHPGLIVTGNGIPNPAGNSIITLTGRSTGEGGAGALCSMNITVKHVGPPTCTVTPIPSRQGGQAGILVSATASPPAGVDNPALYPPTSLVISESGYGRSWSVNLPATGGSAWVRPPGAGTPYYTCTVTGISGTYSTSTAISVGHAACNITASPNPDKMSNPPDLNNVGDYHAVLSMTTNQWTDLASGDYSPSLPYYGGSWDIYPGTCWSAPPSNPMRYNGYVYGVGGSFSCPVDLYLQCPDYMLADYYPLSCSPYNFFIAHAPGCVQTRTIMAFQDYCIRPITTDEHLFGAAPAPIPPHNNTIVIGPVTIPPTAWYGPVYENPGGIWVNCADAEYAINNPPTCQWVHCGAASGGGCNNRGCEGGCFDLNAMILMADKTLRQAINVHAGDLVWNPVRKEPRKVRKTILGPEPFKLYEIGWADRRVKVSKEHPMVTRAGMKRADQVKRGDEILGDDFAYHPITVLRRLPIAEQQKVINFDLETKSDSADDHMLVADGIITGDWFLQQELARNLPKKTP